MLQKMAGECPHNAHLQAALTHCHDNSKLMADTHESYLKIIDDLKNDLEQISSEVIMVQKEYSETDEVDLETSLKELETQNDRLEQALKLQTQTTDAAFNELQTNNTSLKCQNDNLQRRISEQEQQIFKLRTMLKSISESQCIDHSRAVEYVHSHSNCCGELEKKIEQLTKKLEKTTKHEYFLHIETRKLNEELIESKRKNEDLVSQSQRLAALLKSQESYRMELIAKYEQLEKNFEDQTKQLRAANSQLSLLNDRFQTMETRQTEHNMERKLLREEVLALKEKEACVMAKHKSIQEHLLKTERELYTAHDVIKEQQHIQHRTENAHCELVKRLQESNIDLKKNLTKLTESYKNLKEEHDKKSELLRQSDEVIKSFHKWQEMQKKAEDNARENIKEYEQCMKMFLDDKQRSLENYSALQTAYSILQIELDRVKGCAYSNYHYNSSHNASERSIAERLQLVRQTTRRVSEQSSSFKEGEPTPERWDNGKPSEEPL